MDAAAFIRDDLPAGNMFNSYNWGGYLLWELPHVPVFIDGRTDLYNDEIISQWLQVVRVESGWQEVLEKWDVGWVLLENGSDLQPALQANGWRLLYQDALAVVLSR